MLKLNQEELCPIRTKYLTGGGARSNQNWRFSSAGIILVWRSELQLLHSPEGFIHPLLFSSLSCSHFTSLFWWKDFNKTKCLYTAAAGFISFFFYNFDFEMLKNLNPNWCEDLWNSTLKSEEPSHVDWRPGGRGAEQNLRFSAQKQA